MHKRFFHCQSFCPFISSPEEKKFGLISPPQEASASLFFLSPLASVVNHSFSKSYFQGVLSLPLPRRPSIYQRQKPNVRPIIIQTLKKVSSHQSKSRHEANLLYIAVTKISPSVVIKVYWRETVMLLQLDYVYHLHGVKQNLPDTGISCHLPVFKDSPIISWCKDIFLFPQKTNFSPRSPVYTPSPSTTECRNGCV